MVQGEAGEETNPNQRIGFTVRKADDKFTNAVDDFERYRDKKEWEKAFRSLANITSVDPKVMAPAKNGFMLPARQRLMDLLVSLPPEGREAYRLFNDAPAKQLYDQAVAAGANAPADELPLLRKVVEQYFIASVGDEASDRLGDALFESGDFLGAESVWASITEKYPDSDVNMLRLSVKRGVAMARGKRWDSLNDLISQLKEKSAGQAVTIAGKDVVAAEYLSTLIEPTTRPSQSTAIAKADADGPITLPSSDTPVWQCQFMLKEVTDKITERMNNWWGGAAFLGPVASFVPSADTDGKRVYCNWLGACFAVDASNGKMLWRTDKFDEISQKADQFVQSMPDVTAYGTMVMPNDRVLFVRVPVKRINYDEPLRMTCHDSATGQQKWSSEAGTLGNYAFLGKPVIVDDVVYAAAKARQGAELLLLTIDPANGKLINNLTIGQAAAGTNYRGNTIVPSPQLLYHQGKLFILTNNGGVVAIDPATRQIMWAFQCNGPSQINQNDWWAYRNMQQKAKTPGVMLIHDGVMYFKERGVDDLYALDLSGPSLKWKRPVDESDMICGIGDGRLLTVGYDAGAIDIATKQLKWSTRVPLDTGMIEPLLDGKSLFVFSGRGLYEIDPKDGRLVKIFRGADKDAMGGVVWRTGQKLITVSNQAVTAYALNGSARAN